MKIPIKQLLLLLLISSPLLIWLSMSKKKSISPSQENIAPSIHPLFSTAHWGMHVIDAHTHETIASYQPSHFFIPASVIKVFTAAMALETLGPTHTFDTTVASSSLPDDTGHLHGNLYLIGGADPFLNSQALRELAQQVYDKGVRTIEGDIIADHSLFQGPALPTHVTWEDLITDFGSETNALSINGNIIKLRAAPHPTGNGLAFLRAEQEVPYCQTVNLIETQRNKKLSLSITRGLFNNRIEVKGSIPAGHAAITATCSLYEPHEYARLIFIEALEDCDISVERKALSQDSSHPYEIARHASLPLSEIIYKMNKESDALAANLLFKYLSESSSSKQPIVSNPWKKWMEQFSISSQDYALYDGSGLSRQNLITPLQTVKLLEYMSSSSHKDVYLSSLPIAGSDGTLVDRLQKKPPNIVIRAKTGHLSGICNLAGFIEMAPNKQFIFAIFINHSPLSCKEMDAALDALLLHIINHNSENNLSYDH